MFKSIFLLGLLVSKDRVSALEVTPGSSCSAICLKDTESDPLDPESSNTDISEITCNDDEYGSTSTGIKYKNCLDCLQRSNATQEAESDATWYLYNLRYSVDVCVYGFPNASKRVSSPCDINTACGPLKEAMVAGNLDPDRDPYEYCTADRDVFSGHVLDACIQCMASSETQYFMANFMTALKAGCEQRPTGGNLLGLSGTLFTDSTVEITDPPSNETFVGPEGSSGTMSQGTIVGIAVGAALLFLGGTALFWAYHRKQKRLYGEPVGSDYDPRGGGSKSITPPLVGGYNGNNCGSGGKPMVQVSEYEMQSQRKSSYYATNAEYYAALALEKETTTMTHQHHSHSFAAPPRQPEHAFDPNNPATLPIHFTYDPRTTHSRQSSHHSHSRSQGSTPEPRLRPAPAVRMATDNNNKPPGSYALQAYLGAAEESNILLPGPPPGLPPPPAAAVASSRGPSPSSVRTSASSLSHGRAASLTQTQTQQHTTRCSAPESESAPPPPPPPPASVPALSLPSVPRIRVPKKYAPPRITVEGATPVDAPSEQQH
ncbi:hypothetical protein DL764_007547 [Monosporascus ibericus]|uniref:LPXTG-domain-containing protein n=1 Tax=Monosporascus ibericus TaxID=155417 RepID=A0A4V1X9J6_9PEZI|nr:hypothetical protein DL764_007547 [Monosporascus ibericus]